MSNYFNQRLSKLGITDQLNTIHLLRYDAQTHKNVLKPEPIFRRHEKGIEIIVYNLQRETFRIEKDGSRMKKDWSIIRLENPVVKPNGDTLKYLMPKGNGSYPFLPPRIIEKYENKTPVEVLYLTEGFFKAFKGAIHGLDIIGLASITHLKNKQTGALHEDIISIIKTCAVKRVVWLTDGDCLDISSKAFMPGKETAKESASFDLYKRPSQFFASINTFKQLLDDYDCDKYFMHVDSDNILSHAKAANQDASALTRDDVKGLDDVLISYPGRIEEIAEDLHSVSRNGEWFQKFNITYGLSKVRDYFRLNNVVQFYLYHAERNPALKGQEFTFNGTRYKYNEDKGDCDVIIPGDAKKYFRVGDSYYKWIKRQNAYRQQETIFKGRLKSTIMDDHGKEFVKHIIKYEDFINVPDHVNYQASYDNCFNVYCKLDYEPDEEQCTEQDCPTIINYIKHLFGESTVHFTHPVTKQKTEYKNYELGLDYVQLLYQRPTEKLPILCLVSKENNTGKSTFANLLRLMFGSNCAIVGNQDLAGDFNAHWCTKLIVACDETKIDKHAVIEKVKSLSTAKKITLNAKGKDQTEIDCFIKFIFITNNEENFIYASEDDIRYWVIKVPVLNQENPTILDNMAEEIPAFLSFLNRRKLLTEKLNRMWFHPLLLKTEALKKVIQFSKPTIEKELIQYMKDAFLDFGVQQIMMTAEDVRKEIFNNRSYERNYIANVLKERFHIQPFHVFLFKGKEYSTEQLAISNAMLDMQLNLTNEFEALTHISVKYKPVRYSFPRWERFTASDGKTETKRVEVSGNGRPYVFNREQFLTPEEIAGTIITEEHKYINSLTPAADNHIPVSDPAQSLPF